MAITPVSTLVSQAKEQIETLLQEDAEAQVKAGTAQFVDIRDIRELKRDGRLPSALHAPRGMLEFWLDPNSSYYQENKIKDTKKMVFFCAMGFRSALATKALVDMGFKNVANAKGGFDALKNAGLKVVQKDKK